MPGVDAPDPLDVSRAELYRDDRWHAPFAHMRANGGIHWTANTAFGDFWSVAAYRPIVEIESRPDVFSSQAGGITIADFREGVDVKLPMFIAMDRPKHTGQRRTVAPAFAPSEMARMTAQIRRRTGEVLDGLPHGQTFDWVERVSVELTTGMLAILFDFPWAERHKLTLWSDWAGDIEVFRSDEARRAERLRHVFECGAYFQQLWADRLGKAPTPDLISMMIHSDAMAHMDMQEFIGNLILLIVGGNDTTRSTMSAVAWGLSLFPDERTKLEQDVGLIPNAVQELIRWQTPLAHMRRTAKVDYRIDGVEIRAGDKVALWYISANRDQAVFDDADRIRVDRPNARRHLSFGHGIHRCVGARLAELQVTVLLEELAARRLRVEPGDQPTRVPACFVHGYRAMPVELTRY